ncbi:ATP-binding cassette domain-containing protein, partial [uncultured Bradyrhizobium sp.]
MANSLEVRGVSLRFGGVRALTDVSFSVNEGELFSIIGPNGAGKTT